MGVSRLLARLATRATQVLVVEVPGQWITRVELERQMLRRGWRQAWAPADADVLAVCGVPGSELAQVVDRLWNQMPGPRARADILSSGDAGSALDNAATLLLDTPHHRAEARGRRHMSPLEVDGQMNHGGMDHDGHHQMNHGGMDHGDHGGMDMAPEGIPLAQGGEDRDGLEMDVLHLPLGPVLPFWPAGLVLSCSLQGDVVVDSVASVVDGHGARPLPAVAPTAAVRCDNVMALLALSGAEDAAARIRTARDALLRGDQAAARDGVERVRRALRRSWLLRCSLRGVLPLDTTDLARHGLPEDCLGDAHDRLLSTVERIRVEITWPSTDPIETAVPWESVPHLVTGSELATVRLAVASLGLAPFRTALEAQHA